MNVIDCVQRSPEWRQARLGKLTGSCAAEMLSSRKDGKEAAGRRNLRIRLALERITGKAQESEFQSDAMRQGIERELDAVGLYESVTGRLIQSVGFCQHDTLQAGCSPDGSFNGFEGIVEVKSPLPATHWDYLSTGVIPDDYRKQITASLWITGAEWCDWLSYNPDFPAPLDMKLVRVAYDPKEIAAFELMAVQFLREVDEQVEQIRRLAGAAA